MEYVIIGKVRDTFGTKGELKVIPIAPEDVFKDLKKVYLKRAGGGYVPFQVGSLRKHGEFIIVKFKGYDSVNKVEQFKGAHLFLPEDELPRRNEDEFYLYELIGMKVVTDKGKELGRVKRVEDFGVYDMLILEDERIMVPFVGDIVLRVDRDERLIEVKEDLIPL